MKYAVPYLLVALLLPACGRDEPAKPEVSAPPVTQAPAPVTPAEPPAAPESTKPQTAAAAAAATYTVRRGDTLQAIAKKHNVDYRELAKWNDIRNPNRISVGQELRLSPPARK